MMKSTFLIYKSSAGSGKTTALVAVFLRLMLSQAGPDRFRKILAITFTNKATAEMKERLLHELHKLSNLHPSYSGGDFMTDGVLHDTGLTPEALRERASAAFVRMLFDYGELAISTIDHFNHKLIRAFSRELKLRADFEVEIDVKNLFSEAVMRTVEQVGYNPQLTAHLTAYVAQQHDEERRTNIIGDLEKLLPLVINEDAVAPMKYLESLHEDAFQQMAKALKDFLRGLEAEMRQVGEEATAMVESIGASADHFNQKSRGWIPYFQKLAALKGDIPVPSDKLQSIVGEPWAHKTAPAAVRSAINGAEPQLRTFAEKAVAMAENQLPTYYLSKEVLSRLHLMATITDLGQSMQHLCDDRNILPIAYFNRTISEALRNEPVAFIYENLGARFDHILIDEFQDTSEMQWLNLLPLVEESISRGNTSLVVGDAKQSIYRWRGGKAEQLIALPEIDKNAENLPPGLRQALIDAHEIVQLNTNFRSAQRVIDFNNKLFAALSNVFTPPDTLYRQEYSEVRQHVPDRRQGQGLVELNYLGVKAEVELQHDLVLAQIFRAEAAGYRRSDMCILVRGKREGNALANYLIDSGVRVATSDSRTIDQDLKVQLLVAMLRLHAQPGHNPSKVMAMRALSLLHSVPYEPGTFATPRSKSSRRDLDLYAFLRKLDLPLPRSGWFESGAYQACEYLIGHYLPDARNDLPVSVLLNFMLGKGGLKLTVREFLQQWDLTATKPGAGDATGDQSVQMLTIHKAKGLQFKVCIVPFVNWRKSNNTEIYWMALDPALQVPLDYAPLAMRDALTNMGLEKALVAEKQAIDFDNLNLLYVALTRAEEVLFINYTQTNASYVGKAFDVAVQAMLPDITSMEGITQSHPAAEGGYPDLAFGDEAWRLAWGDFAKAEVTEKSMEQAGASVAAVLPPTAPWTQRFPLAFDASSIGTQVARKMGVYFHRLASETKSYNEATQWVQRLLGRGEIEQNEEARLAMLSATLYNDKKYLSLLENYTAYPERDFVYQGQVLRPDLVFGNEEGWVVVDFKTGDPADSHRQQLKGYTEAIAAVTGKNAEGFLLYLDPLRWVAMQGENTA